MGTKASVYINGVLLAVNNIEEGLKELELDKITVRVSIYKIIYNGNNRN